MPIARIAICWSLVFFFFNFNIDGNYFTYKWIFFELAILSVLSVGIYKKYSLFLALTIFYFLCQNALLVLFSNNPSLIISLSKGATTTTTSVIFLLLAPKYINKSIHSLFLFLLVTCCAQVFIGYPFEGFTGNTSLNATLIALLFPLSIPAILWINSSIFGFFLLAFISILKTGASTGCIALICSFTIYLLMSNNSMKKKYHPVLICFLSLAVSVLAYFYYGEKAYSLSGRPDIWHSMIEYVKKEGNYLIGSGVGSGFYLIQKAILTYSENKKELTPWGHNEILQVFFEAGIIGLLLSAASFFHFIAVSIKRKRIYLVAFGISYLINCCGNFSHRLAPDTFLILCAIVLAYGDSNECCFKTSV